MTHDKQTTADLALVLEELDKAKAKHPEFVNAFATGVRNDPKATSAKLEWARYIRLRDTGNGAVDFFDVIQEELYEALDAHAKGLIPGAVVVELAQCAALCLRAMEYVRDEAAKEASK